MSPAEEIEQQWIGYVENEFSMQTTDLTIPQHFMLIDNAVDLASRLKLILILVDDNYIFTVDKRAETTTHRPGPENL